MYGITYIKMENLKVIFEATIILVKIPGKTNIDVASQPWSYSILYSQNDYLSEILFILVKQ